MKRPQADDPFASSSPRVQTLPGRAPFRGSPTSPRYAVEIIRMCSQHSIGVDMENWMRKARDVESDLDIAVTDLNCYICLDTECIAHVQYAEQ
ncbi:jg12396 [Pararge aegeria aegeria]|uniref:Jg12396 protein n=1 Tax=Pararge aegeria aegeria TaxID=348720 RepID=A0A8S4S9W7_9NEOP|nr:jg12396 [Pararge aegeria aegeria]